MLGWLLCKLGVHDTIPSLPGFSRCVRCGKFR